ncbi:hypothetical protein BFS07_03645 [Clostridium perfringens]|uniref:hypothetical protein n=1 Tax=Clostridium perfringens TaxID=1502 RepID=UPI000D51001E|nr:hypothetical protein [Clostridium perfringens]MCX0401982.1 hypothetical protein [Clostridium perfringens]PVE15629.1 hypothetical protein DDA98_10225 [Clostridium perfringens]TBX09816.1 hypothetical protein BFS07_03645 [Clostridium perfringens]
MKIVDKDYYKKYYEKYNIDGINNLADMPTEFILFMSNMCKKYRLSVDKIAETNSHNRSMGMALNGDGIVIQIYYDYDICELELVVYVAENKDFTCDDIKNDILKYVNTVSYSKGDQVTDNFGEDYILEEDIVEVSNRIKSYKATRMSDGEESKVYNRYIVPKFE